MNDAWLELAEQCGDSFTFDDLVRQGARRGLRPGAIGPWLQRAQASGLVEAGFARRHSTDGLRGARTYTVRSRPRR